jgi:threonyl-tRNA synthetase
VADFSNLARDERPGELHGVLRSRVFTQDDGHAFVREDQIGEEFENILGVVSEALATYGMKYWIRLSLRDPEQMDKYLGDDAIWNNAESKLKEIAENCGQEYREAFGEAAIYGPKMDFMAYDSLGREWQLSTIQLDMNMPGRFGLKYIDADGQEQIPIMIHRAIVGSERFIGIIIEHFGGAFPAWLAPEQVRVISISEDNNDYAQKIAKQLYDVGIFVESDLSNERMQNKIRKAQEFKVPYMLVLGKQEQENETISVRTRDGAELQDMKLQDFITALQRNIAERKLDLTL